MDANHLRFLEPGQTAVAGARCDGMEVRAATGEPVGELQGFVVDPVARRLRYLVVRMSGLFGRARLLPVSATRVDVRERTLQVLDGDALQCAKPFKRELFPSFSDDDLLAAVFGRSAA